MFLFGEKSILEITIWLALTLSMLMILITAIVLTLINNRKNNKKIFTPKKVTIFATFLAILMIQTFIDVMLPSFPGMPSFESATTITVGFMFGIVEGIAFGWIADTAIVLIHGWSYQILPGLMMPVIGMMAGLVRVGFNKSINEEDFENNPNSEVATIRTSSEKEKTSNRNVIIVFQVIMISMMLVMLLTSTTLIKVTGNDPKYDGLQVFAPITCVITIALLELIFFYLLYKGVDKTQLKLLTAILCVAILERALEITVRPFSQYYYNNSYNYFIEFYIRLLRSTYLIPSVTIASFVLIRTTSMVIDL